ncbi:MAG: alkaline phosphatase, partial [Deltaproteobacteria bacterium]|nr:alkaline phosphatase [Deltaproteobacteria bacterium]
MPRFSTGIFDESAAEIVAYDPTTQRLFVSNDDAKRIDILDISDPEEPTFVGTIDLSAIRDNKTKPTSVAFRDGLGAAVVKNKPITDEGFV